MSEGNAIVQSLCDVMSEMAPLGKDAVNQDQGYNYRSAQKIYDAVGPLFAKHGIVMLPEVCKPPEYEQRQTRRGGTMTHVSMVVNYRFMSAKDGSVVSVTVASEALDTSDKATNKAMTFASKYALNQVLAIPFEMVDGEADDLQASPAVPEAKVKPPKQQPLKINWADKSAGFDAKLKEFDNPNDLDKFANEGIAKCIEHGAPEDVVGHLRSLVAQRHMELDHKAVAATGGV